MTVRGALVVGTLGVACVPSGAWAFPGLHVIYTSAGAARAIHDGSVDQPGLTQTHRQAPIREDMRWPTERRIGKVSGRSLARMQPSAMVRTFRAAWEAPGVGDLVGVDEITASDWTPEASRDLRTALDTLGTDANRVMLYISPGLVGQIGRVDLRRRLPARLAEIFVAIGGAGAIHLEMYHGDGTSFTRSEFAEYATRWLARWAPADPGKLHLLLGRAVGVGQAELWSRARSSPAGRTLLANGAGVYGLREAAEGADWLVAYRVFAAQPAVPPPEGDTPVAVGGGLVVVPGRGRSLTVLLSRRARAVVRLIPLSTGRGRVVAKVNGPTSPAGLVIRLPTDLRPGRYRIVTVALGDGLRDVSNVPFRVGGTAPRVASQHADAR